MLLKMLTTDLHRRLCTCLAALRKSQAVVEGGLRPLPGRGGVGASNLVPGSRWGLLAAHAGEDLSLAGGEVTAAMLQTDACQIAQLFKTAPAGRGLPCLL